MSSPVHDCWCRLYSCSSKASYCTPDNDLTYRAGVSARFVPPVTAFISIIQREHAATAGLHVDPQTEGLSYTPGIALEWLKDRTSIRCPVSSRWFLSLSSLSSRPLVSSLSYSVSSLYLSFYRIDYHLTPAILLFEMHPSTILTLLGFMAGSVLADNIYTFEGDLQKSAQLWKRQSQAFTPISETRRGRNCQEAFGAGALQCGDSRPRKCYLPADNESCCYSQCMSHHPPLFLVSLVDTYDTTPFTDLAYRYLPWRFLLFGLREMLPECKILTCLH